MAAGLRTVRIRFTGDSKGLVASTVAAETAVERFQDKISKGFPNAVKATAQLAAAIGSASTAANLMAGAGAGIAAATGALLALPAAGVAAAGVMAAVQLGADGAKKAFEGLSKSVDPLKQQVGAAFERGLAPAVDSLNATLPKLGGGLTQVASGLSGIAVEAARTVALPENVSILNNTLGSTSGLLDGLRRAVGPLIQAFLDIVSVGTTGFGGLGDRIAAAAERFATFIREAKESGQLAQFLENGKAALAQFAQTLQDMGAIVVAVLGGLSAGAGGIGAAFAPAIAAVRQFVESAQGQEVLRALGAAMAQIGQAVTAVLAPALRALSPLLGPLATLFADVVTAVSGLIAPLIEFLSPALSALAGFLQQNLDWLGPLAVAIGVATAALWLLNAALLANPIVLVIGFIALLVAAFIGLWEKSEGFRNFFIGVWNAIRSAVGAVVDWIRGAWDGLMGFFRGIPDFFRGIGEGIANGIKSGIKGAINFIIGIINGLISGVNILIQGINLVNPFDDIPQIPKIPKLARGGRITQGGLAVVGEKGREIVSLPTGAQVIPNGPTEALLGGAPEVRVFIGDRELTDLVRVEIREAHRQIRRDVMAGVGGAR